MRDLRGGCMSRPFVFRIKSFSKPGVTYLVRYDGQWRCLCPSRPRPCKHETILRVLGPKRVAELVKIAAGKAVQCKRREGYR